jgi:predicted transcriptional regulator
MKTISVRLSDEEKEMFDNYCKDLDLSMSHIMRKLIKDFIANKAKEEEGSDSKIV